jgi:hypothetical protein
MAWQPRWSIALMDLAFRMGHPLFLARMTLYSPSGCNIVYTHRDGSTISILDSALP